VGLVHKDAVNTEFLESDGLVFLLTLGPILNSLGQPFLTGFQDFHDTATGFISRGLADRLFERVKLFLHIGIEQTIRDREKLKAFMRDDDGVIIASYNT